MKALLRSVGFILVCLAGGAHAATLTLDPVLWDPTPSGLLVTGRASGVGSSLTAKVLAGGGERWRRTVRIASSGRFGIAIPPGVLQAGENVTVRVEAAGIAHQLSLSVISPGRSLQHLISRITFGPTPALLKEAKTLGWTKFLDRQLRPEAIDDSVANQAAARLPTQETYQLQFYFLYRMLSTQAQLRELMTWFWENHFNTHLLKHGNRQWELKENTQFRQHALGRFRDLLDVSAKSAAMLYYLDNHQSRKGAINENYARELLELHTLGVNGGYTQKDVVEVARAFTGWNVASWETGEFVFYASQHDTGPKTVLGTPLPAGRGIEDGEAVLDLLARHPSTARFICTKLARFLIADAPSQATVEDCAQTFLARDGDIRQVLANLLTSAEFFSDRSVRAKLKTPLRYVTSVVRALEPERLGTHDLTWDMYMMGLGLFVQPIPTGWPEESSAWIDSHRMTQRLFFANYLPFKGPDPDYNPRFTYLVDPKGYFARLGLETAEAICGWLFQVLAGGDYTPREWEIAYSLLGDGFTLNDKEADQKLRKAISFVIGAPGTQRH
ncbi:MAG: DUF1800 domain-containing protein [Methylohalobius sp.]|nr:DUF1800 domain-containing protein [Methylohalobius sp.]